MQALRISELRAGLHLRSEQDSSTWAWRQQVHLARLDCHRRGVYLRGLLSSELRRHIAICRCDLLT